MNWENIRNRILLITVVSISIGVIFPSETGFAQNYLRLDNEIPGGTPSNDPESSSNDNTTMYVVGGAIIAGILVYALVFKKDKAKEEKTDSTSASVFNSENILANDFSKANYGVVSAREKLPIDVYLGIRENKAVINDKTYLMGVSVRF